MSVRPPASPKPGLDKAAIAQPLKRETRIVKTPVRPETKPPYAPRRGADKRPAGFHASGFASLSSDASQSDYQRR